MVVYITGSGLKQAQSALHPSQPES